MGTTMTLLKAIQNLHELDEELTIYAAKPWNENSKTMLLKEDDTDETIKEAKKLGFEYFLEVFIIKDFLKDWELSLDHKPTAQEKCLRIIEYATRDA